MGKKTVYEREHIGSVTVKTTIMSFMEEYDNGHNQGIMAIHGRPVS